MIANAITDQIAVTAHAGSLITAPDDIGIGHIHRPSRIDRSSNRQIGKQTIVIRISSRGEGSTIYVGRGGINGMMVSKLNALVREFVECRRVSLSHKIRPHSIPNDQHDVTRFVLSRRGHGKRADSEGQQRSPRAR